MSDTEMESNSDNEQTLDKNHILTEKVVLEIKKDLA